MMNSLTLIIQIFEYTNIRLIDKYFKIVENVQQIRYQVHPFFKGKIILNALIFKLCSHYVGSN